MIRVTYKDGRTLRIDGKTVECIRVMSAEGCASKDTCVIGGSV